MARTGHFQNMLEGDLRYTTFIPSQLPLLVNYDSELQTLQSRADIALGRLDMVSDVLPNVDFFIFMYVRKEATLSSQIEGTQATFIDVLKAEAKIEDSEIHKDVDEVMNYISAMNYGLERLKSLPLSVRLLKEIHAKLLKGVRGEWKTPGEMRKSQNWIGGSSINTAKFVPPPHEEVSPLMSNLEKNLHEREEIPILIKIGLAHAQFETIHPFLDGNGRIGRLLITFYLCHQGVIRKPLLYLSDFFKENRAEYYDRLNLFREKDDVEGWLKFFLQGVLSTSENALDTSRKIIKLRDSDIAKITKLGKSAESGMKVLNSLYESPLVRIKDVERITGLKNPNALSLVSRFEKLGILKEITGKQRNRVYTYNDYVKLFTS